MNDLTMQRVLEVVRDFDGFGGASPALIAWELRLDPAEVDAAWAEAVARDLVDPAAPAAEALPGLAPSEDLDERMWRLSPAGWQLLGVNPEADRRRAATIARLGVMDRISDPALTALARITAYVTGASASAVHIFDERYQHRIAAFNAPQGHHPAHDSMCRLVVDGGVAIICADATQDPRFDGSTFIQGPEPIRFYASIPLRTAQDHTVVGTLCAFDTAAIELTDTQREILIDLAQQAITQIEFVRVAVELDELVPPID
jgi:GAF domain-containing protein